MHTSRCVVCRGQSLVAVSKYEQTLRPKWEHLDLLETGLWQDDEEGDVHMGEGMSLHVKNTKNNSVKACVFKFGCMRMHVHMT